MEVCYEVSGLCCTKPLRSRGQRQAGELLRNDPGQGSDVEPTPERHTCPKRQTYANGWDGKWTKLPAKVARLEITLLLCNRMFFLLGNASIAF